MVIAMVMKLLQMASNVNQRLQANPRIGIIHAFNSTVLLAFRHFSAQLAIQSCPTLAEMEVSLIRSAEEVVMLIPFILLIGSRVLFAADKWLHLFLISLTGYGSFLLMYYALDLIPISIALSLSATCPFFATIFSFFILKEKCVWLDNVCGITSFLGILLIARPVAIFGKYGKKEKTFFQDVSQHKYELIYLAGCGLALLFGICRAVYLVLTRKWGRDSMEKKSMIPVIYPSMFGVLITPALMLVSGERLEIPKEPYGAYSLFSVGIFSSFGLVCLSLALTTQNATVVGVMRNLEIVWAFMLQYFIMGIVPSWGGVLRAHL